MTGAWQTLYTICEAERDPRFHGGKAPAERSRDQAGYIKQLMKLITQRYGEHDAEELRARLTDPKREDAFKDFEAFADEIESNYGSDEINKVVKALGRSLSDGGGSGSEKGQESQPSFGRGERPRVSPETAAEKQARIDAMRQARQGVGQGGDTAVKTLMTPGKKQGHAVGSAGQNPQRPATLHPKATSGPATSAGIAAPNPDGKVARSGVVKAQREVDKETQENGKEAGERLAASLGVPTTAERTVEDEKTGETKVQIWGPDRVLKFMDADHNPHRQTPNVEPLSRLDLIKRGLVGGGSKGLANADQQGPKDPKTGEVRPPQFDGEVWQPHGRVQQRATMRPDQATGNWKYGKAIVDPKSTGQQLVGLNGKWVLPSVYASRERNPEKRAGEKPYVRGADRDMRVAAADTADRDMARKVAGSPRLQKQVAQLAKMRGIDLGLDQQDDDDDDEYPEDQGWRKV